MDLEIYQVDSFTSEPFKGNPAGVCITENALDESLMFAIAAEMAVSETAFLSLSDLRLRWFTPKVEVSLCGHGTLAAAHILKEKGIVSVGEEVAFNTLSGSLLVKVEEKHIEMDFPAATIDFNIPTNGQILDHLGITPDQIASFGIFDSKHFIEISNDRQLLDLKPNFDGLKQLPGRGVVVTAKSESKKVDFISRYFAPWVGVNEDPVTGSAHCALAVYWGQKLSQLALTGYQASERGGFVNVELLSNRRVKLIGDAVTVLKGTMHV
jgi:PhzF family phenazine biosynthesis protein